MTIKWQSFRAPISDELHTALTALSKVSKRSIGSIVAKALVEAEGDNLKEVAFKLGLEKAIEEIDSIKGENAHVS